MVFGYLEEVSGATGNLLEQPAGRQPHLYQIAQHGVGSRMWQVAGASC